jgi:meso-butanediol dehydrogenase / (S,S)-butanediol dehydrogenase / diacetyl reductase
VQRFADRIAVVADAGNPVGRACAERLAVEGARVVLLCRSESEPAAADDADAIVVDVSDEEAVARASAAVVDRVDVLVNCHAALEWTSIEASTLDDWHESIRVNLLGPLVCTRALLPQLRRGRSPSVVHIGSIDGALGNPHVPAYSTAKGGLVPLTHVMAHELAADGIRVNCVARAAVAGFPPLDESRTAPVVAATPLGRQALPSEIAAAVAFLASDDASYITGTVLTVDGGRSGLTPGTISTK